MFVLAHSGLPEHPVMAFLWLAELFTSGRIVPEVGSRYWPSFALALATILWLGRRETSSSRWGDVIVYFWGLQTTWPIVIAFNDGNYVKGVWATPVLGLFALGALLALCALGRATGRRVTFSAGALAAVALVGLDSLLMLSITLPVPPGLP